MTALILPRRLTQQPQGFAQLTPEFADVVVSGFVGDDYLNGRIGYGSAPTPSSGSNFDTVSYRSARKSGRALSADPATVTTGTTALDLPYAPTRNNFTLFGVIEVRAITGVGVGIRSNTNDIFLWRASGNYQVRINNVTIGTSIPFPLSTQLNYVLTSNPSGIWLFVNGAQILSAAASASSSDTGVAVQMYEDSRGGGAMDMDVSLIGITSKGISRDRARDLSSNPWQLFRAPSRTLYFDIGAGASDSGAGSSSGTSTASGVGASTAESTGSAAGVGAASGAGQSSSEATGGATGSSAVSGIGASVAESVGSAAGTSTASGVGESSVAGSGIGSAAGTSSATGVGASDVGVEIGAAGRGNYHGLVRDYLDRYRKKKREEEEEAEKLAELQREAERLAELQQEADKAAKEVRLEKKKRKRVTPKARAKEPDYSAEIALARLRIEQQIAAIDAAEWQRDIAEIAYLLEVARQEEMREIEAQQMRDEEEAILLLLM